MINFKEDKKSLNNRLSIHKKYGSKDLATWIVQNLKLKKRNTYNILDVGCGDGKLLFKIQKKLKKDKIKSIVLGIDTNKKLIEEAKKKKKSNIKFKVMNVDKKMRLNSNFYDVVLSNFAIYYASNIDKTFKKIKNYMKQNSIIFLTGPLEDNKIDFNKNVEKAFQKKIPKLIGSSRFSKIIFEIFKNHFSKVKMHVMKNELTFKNSQPYMEYAEAVLMKKRGVYEKFLKGLNYKKSILKLEQNITEIIKEKGNIKITKKVGGIFGVKI